MGCGVGRGSRRIHAGLKYLEQGGDGTYLEPVLKAFGKRRLASIKSGEIRDLAKKLKPNAKALTRNRHVIVPARAVINFAAERGLCPHIRVKNFKEAKVKKRAIDREWIDTFMKHATNPHIGVVALFMFTTGARISEVVWLSRSDVGLDGMKATLGKTKNGDPRTYYLTKELVAHMRTLAPKRVKDGTWRVFGYFRPACPQRAWEKTVERAGIPYVSRHERGRHSFATEMMVRRGIDAKTTADLGGWEDPAMLLRRYVHSEKLEDVAEKVFGRCDDTKLAHASDLKLVNTKKAWQDKMLAVKMKTTRCLGKV